MTTVPPAARVTDAMRAAASRQPDSWFYVIDPFFDPNGKVPAHGIVGWYRVDAQGVLLEEFNPNPDYRPSPISLGLPRPENQLELILQCVATGYTHEAELALALLSTSLFTLEQGGGMAVFADESGRPYVEVFTSASKVPAEVRPMEISGMLLAQVSGQAAIRINAGSSVSTVIPVGTLHDSDEPKATNTVEIRGIEYELDRHGEGIDHGPGGECVFARGMGMAWGSDMGEALGVAVRGLPAQEIWNRYGPQGIVVPAEGIDRDHSIFADLASLATCVAVGVRRARRQGGHRVLADTAVPFDLRPFDKPIQAPVELCAAAYVSGLAVAMDEDAKNFFPTALSVAGQFRISRADQITGGAYALLLHKIVIGGSLTDAVSDVVAAIESLGEPDSAELLSCLRDWALSIAPGRETTVVDAAWLEAAVAGRPSLARLVAALITVVRGTTTWEEAARTAVNTSADSSFLGFLAGQLAGAIGDTLRLPGVGEGEASWPRPSRWGLAVLQVLHFGIAMEQFDDSSLDVCPLPPSISGPR